MTLEYKYSKNQSIKTLIIIEAAILLNILARLYKDKVKIKELNVTIFINSRKMHKEIIINRIILNSCM